MMSSLVMIYKCIHLMSTTGLNPSDYEPKHVHNRAKENEHIKKYSEKANANLQALLNSDSSRNVQAGCTGTLILLPHCETGFEIDRLGKRRNEDDMCSLVGLQRAYYLITQFGAGSSARWPIPDKIIVVGDKFMRMRAIETVAPVQRFFSVNGKDTPSIYKDRNKLSDYISDIAMKGDLCGKLIIITPTLSSEIANIALDLGCGPLDSGDGCPMSFNERDNENAWQLKFIYDIEDDPAFDGDNSNATATATDKKTVASEQSDRMRWKVFGNVVQERFDPLAFSKLVGEFDPTRTNSNENSVKEKHNKHDYPIWMNMSIYNDFVV